MRYDRHYFDTALGPVPYDRQHREWLDFFGAIAEHVVAGIGPGRVLDVGCAKGFLVEALRDRGVQAFGIDISEYAIGEVRPDIRPYCRVASATESFQERYDLIVCIEVLEHLEEADGRRAIANICRSTDDVLFSSTPDDFTEPTHVTVRPRSWWIERFAEHGFQLDVAYDAGFIAAHAMRFRSGRETSSPLDRVLVQRHQLLSDLAAVQRDAEARRHQLLSDLAAVRRDAEARRDRLQSDLAAVQRGAEALRHELTARRLDVSRLEVESENLRQTIAARDGLIAQLQGVIQTRDERIAGLERSAAEKDALIAGLHYHLDALQRTIGWRVLERLRSVRDRWLPPGLYAGIRHPIERFLDEGPLARRGRTTHAEPLGRPDPDPLVDAPPPVAVDPPALYRVWLRRHRRGPEELARMKAAAETFPYAPVISVVTPVHDTDEVWLRKAVESVRAQIYPRWELCLVNDGSTRPHVRTILDEYAAAEPRVRVEHLPANEGIAGASAHGLRLATGDFVALLDHDDELPPEALFEVVQRLNAEPDLDLIYTDEDKLEPDGRRVEPFFKPDWSPDLLLSMNYITHLSVFRRSVLETIGGFRLGLDGSQDYDLLLRFTERARRIAHIPQILYHWRKAAGSAAASTSAKPHAYEAARQAIEAALRRRGHEAEVTNALPGLYTARYALRGSPLVSIIVPAPNRPSLLRECLRSLEERTGYPRYEVVVVYDDGVEPDARRELDAIARVRRVHPRPGPSGISALYNTGAAEARGDCLVFLDAGIRAIAPGWLGAMIEHAQRAEVGAVGARVHDPDGRIWHAGLILGIGGGVADHAFRGLPVDSFTYFALGAVVRNVSAVSGAGMTVRRDVFEDVKGFDERLQVALHDVDLCLRLRQRGYLIVYTPHAVLQHHDPGARARPSSQDEELVWATWGDVIRKGDPYYNPNLTLTRTDWSLGD